MPFHATTPPAASRGTTGAIWLRQPIRLRAENVITTRTTLRITAMALSTFPRTSIRRRSKENTSMAAARLHQKSKVRHLSSVPALMSTATLKLPLPSGGRTFSLHQPTATNVTAHLRTAVAPAALREAMPNMHCITRELPTARNAIPTTRRSSMRPAPETQPQYQLCRGTQ